MCPLQRRSTGRQAAPSKKIIITGDIHLNHDESSEYRWKLLPFLLDLKEEVGARGLWVLGDLTVHKDRHPSRLVNGMVELFRELGEVFDFVDVLMGNHDWLHVDAPFFEFLRILPRVHFVSSPVSVSRLGLNVKMLPHTRDEQALLRLMDDRDPDVFLMHHTFSGARVSSGVIMPGTDVPEYVETSSRLFISGDIHVPQTVHGVIYAGSPYHINFGDAYVPRVLVLDAGTKRVTSIPSEGYFPGKYVVRARSLDEFLEAVSTLPLPCLVRVELHIPLDEVHSADQLRVAVLQSEQRPGVTLESVRMVVSPKKILMKRLSGRVSSGGPEDHFRRYCAAQKVDDALAEVGRKLLLGALK